ncbi:hypothetical protein [Pararhizobium sp. IMCC21322]|uniref:hypothetical protein n=1 Tax=Pararhizobium sp. IMCC21322 TaxID=3067903 RepID=UPI0027405211|nr:hypothetical protein [Pararhizobium sp. IMCC21322]
MFHDTISAVLSVVAAVLIALAAIAWGHAVAFVLVLAGLGADWLRYAAEAGRNAAHLYYVTLVAYPLAAVIALAPQI